MLYQAKQKPGIVPCRVDADADADEYKDTLAGSAKSLPNGMALTRGRRANWGVVMRAAKRKLEIYDFRMITAAVRVVR
ncbi:MAG: hypothetical protein AAF066_01125 [Pseudomonadota bacterium]